MKKKIQRVEPDNVYFLKLVMYFIVGGIWVIYNTHRVLPLGLILGLLFARSDHFAIDRKIEYAILLIATLLGFYGYGVFLKF